MSGKGDATRPYNGEAYRRGHENITWSKQKKEDNDEKPGVSSSEKEITGIHPVEGPVRDRDASQP